MVFLSIQGKMKIYTKAGDKGQTSLASGKRVSKSDPRVDLYGTCDELNSSLGVAIAFLPENSALKNELFSAQNALFELGSELAGFEKDGRPTALSEQDVQFLESSIDRMQGKLPALKNFILPGGSKASSFLQLSRTICRSLERKMVNALENKETISALSLQYINRLSDYIFVAARYANFEEGVQDVKWEPRS